MASLGDGRAFRRRRVWRRSHLTLERQHAKGAGLPQDQLLRVRGGHPLGSSQRRNHRSLELLAQLETLQRRTSTGKHGPRRRCSSH